MNRRAPYDFYGHRVLLSVKKKGESQRGSGSFVPSHLNDSPLRTTDEAIADLQSVGTALRKPSLKIYHIPTNKSIIPRKNKKALLSTRVPLPYRKYGRRSKSQRFLTRHRLPSWTRMPTLNGCSTPLEALYSSSSNLSRKKRA